MNLSTLRAGVLPARPFSSSDLPLGGGCLDLKRMGLVVPDFSVSASLHSPSLLCTIAQPHFGIEPGSRQLGLCVVY
jgi:hypothetical protein